MNYIEQIRAILKNTSWTQAQLAQELEVTFAALNRWLHLRSRPRPRRLAQIKRLYNERVGFPSLTDQALVPILKQAEALRDPKLWDQIAENQSLQDDLLLEQTYNSTAIEGTTFTKRETEAVLFSKITIPHKSLIEHLEVTNHAAVLRDILRRQIEAPLTESYLKALHRRLMQGIQTDAGEYARHYRGVRGVQITLTHPDDIPEEMQDLLQRWNRTKKKTLREIASFHAHFELIHPFADGNGRLGRLLMVLQCLEQGYPPILIENSRKAEYYETLEYAQKTSENPFIAFLVEQIERTCLITNKYVKTREF